MPIINHFVAPHCGFYAFVNSILILPEEEKIRVLTMLSTLNHQNKAPGVLLNGYKTLPVNLNNPQVMSDVLKDPAYDIVNGPFIDCCVSLLKQQLVILREKRIVQHLKNPGLRLCWFEDNYLNEAISLVMKQKKHPEFLLHKVDLENQDIAEDSKLLALIQEHAAKWSKLPKASTEQQRQSLGSYLLANKEIVLGIKQILYRLHPDARLPQMTTDLDLSLLGKCLGLNVRLSSQEKPYEDPRQRVYPVEQLKYEHEAPDIYLSFWGHNSSGHWTCFAPDTTSKILIQQIEKATLVGPVKTSDSMNQSPSFTLKEDYKKQFNQLIAEIEEGLSPLIEQGNEHGKNYNPNYKKVRNVAQNLIKGLTDATDFFDNPNAGTFKVFQKQCSESMEPAEKEFKNHRGWHGYHPVLKALAGISLLIAGIGVLWLIVAPTQYINTFFKTPPTRSSQKLIYFKQQLEKVTSDVALSIA